MEVNALRATKKGGEAGAVMVEEQSALLENEVKASLLRC